MTRISYLLFSIVLFSCGESSSNNNDNSTFSFNNQNFIIVEKQSLTTSATEIEGTASIVANAPLSSVASGNHFSIEGSLAESSTMTLNTNALSSNLGGLVLKFANNSGSLAVSVNFGEESVDLSDKFSGKSATSISYRMDIHNDETPAHVLIWDGSTADFSEENALYNSEVGPATPGNGTGSFWGATLSNAKLNKLSAETPKFEEE